MRKLMFIVFVALLFIPACSSKPKTEDQKAFYTLGVNLNKQLLIFNLSPEELKYVQQGMSDASAGKKLAVDPPDASMQRLGEIVKARMDKTAEKQKTPAKHF
jgi:FKBP-type peptidyl-prolyl cis-trans isomerase FkpA